MPKSTNLIIVIFFFLRNSIQILIPGNNNCVINCIGYISLKITRRLVVHRQFVDVKYKKLHYLRYFKF